MTLGYAAICGDVAYVSSGPGRSLGGAPSITGSLLAMNLTTGTTLWNVRLTTGSFVGYPTTDGQAVYSIMNNGTVLAFAAKSGALVWKQAFAPSVEAAQTSTRTGNLTTSSTSSATAITSQTVTITFSVTEPYLVDTPPLAAGKLFVTTTDGHVYALDSTSGSQVWATSLGAAIDYPRSSPAIGYGRVFLGTEGGLFALDA